MTQVPELQGGTSAADIPSAEGAASFADTVHEYIREYIALADQKAAFISAIATAMIAFLYQQDIPKLFLKPPAQWTWRSLLAALTTLLLTASISAALAVVVPRRKGPRSGLVFWEAIAGYPSANSYADEVSTQSHSELVRQKLYHCYALAVVCRRKYNHVDTAIKCGGVAFMLAVLLLVSS